MRFGIHTGPQLCTMEELRELWRFADANGFHWVSVWDHFYPAELADHDRPCFEATAAHTALACETRNVRVGCLVYCAAYRHPAVLAKALVTIDHVSGGRMECGLGAGWHQQEFEAHGIPFLPIGRRLDQLEEAIAIVRGLFQDERTTVVGRTWRVDGAYGNPKPLQARPRIWIGGGGEKRLLRIVARHADGWNIPFVAPEVWGAKNAVLDRWCESERRDPRAIVRTVNLAPALAESERDLPRLEEQVGHQFGKLLPLLRPGMLIGTPDRVAERVREYERLGCEWVILALRAPFDLAGLRLFADAVMPRFA
ncbi:MAG TPA: LLM class flavin-dependent oxidoreductase [Candidatus Binatia bacterium]|nr:LLM class flavin-dependent oxidoreductase [Candidatus Binatia bacterium]